MACTSSCRTQDHESWGACMRAKNLRVAYCNSAAGKDYTAQKQFDRGLSDYAAARKQGIQPASVKPAAVRRAVEASDQSGRAYDAGV